MKTLTAAILAALQCAVTVLVATALSGCGGECWHHEPGIGMGMVKDGSVYRYVPMPYEQAIESRQEMATKDQQALDATGLTIEEAVAQDYVWAKRHQAYLRLLSNYEQYKSGQPIDFPYWKCAGI